MEPRLRGSHRDSQHCRDLGERLVEIEVEDHDGPGLRLKACERPVELVAIGDVARVVVDVGFEDRLDVDLDHAPPAAPDLVDAGPHHEAVEPVVERLGVA